MRRFGGDKLINIMNTLGLPEDQPIENKLISRTIENAQSKIEGFNFDIRKHVLDYDDVMNKQREVIYKKRREILEMNDVKPEITEYIKDEIEKTIAATCADEDHCEAKIVFESIRGFLPVDESVKTKIDEVLTDRNKNMAEKNSALVEYLLGLAKEIYGKKEQEIGAETMRMVEKSIVLETFDNMWMNHLDEIDYLREGIGLRGYGQRDPLVEYKREAFNLFSHLMENIKASIVNTIFRISLAPAQNVALNAPVQRNLTFSGASDEVEQFGAAKKLASSASGAQAEGGSGQSEEKSASSADRQKPIVNDNTVGRNDPCPCGSGKKFKKCGLLNTPEHQANMMKGSRLKREEKIGG
jgi:preprotein translocase subunit SecA